MATDVKLFRESGRQLVHRHCTFRDLMPHVSLQGKVISDLIVFVHRAMAVAQMTHLHLSVPSSRTTTITVPPECFPVVPVPHKPRRVSFASDVEVMLSTSTLPLRGRNRILRTNHYRLRCPCFHLHWMMIRTTDMMFL